MRHWLVIIGVLLLIAGCAYTRSITTPAESSWTTSDMPQVVVFHHALGITAGIESFAEHLRDAGYQVVVPDLFEGEVFDSIDDGIAYAEQVGFDEVIERGVASVRTNHGPLVVIGFSLGVLPAQKLAQTRPDVRGAVLCHSAVPVSTFSEAWPAEVSLQLHLVENDPLAAEDIEAARNLAAAAGADLFLYEGVGHLVADPGHRDYDPAIAQQINHRILAFIAGLD